MAHFIELLKWKDAQGLVFFTMDTLETEPQTPTSEILDALNGDPHPFWSQLSARLSKLYDPITRDTYQPLNLDDIWWGNSFKSENSKFEVSSVSILEELYFLNLKYKPMRQILYQSNPQSLNPIIAYNNDTECIHDKQPVIEYKDESGLVIFSDYFNE